MNEVIGYGAEIIIHETKRKAPMTRSEMICELAEARMEKLDEEYDRLNDALEALEVLEGDLDDVSAVVVRMVTESYCSHLGMKTDDELRKLVEDTFEIVDGEIQGLKEEV